MKIINKLFEITYYGYYLLYKNEGGARDTFALQAIAFSTAFYIGGMLALVGALLGSAATGLFLSLFAYPIIQWQLDKKVYNTGIIKKIIKKKPIIYSSELLSKLISILETAICIIFFAMSLYWAKEIQENIYGESRSAIFPLEEIFNYFHEKFS